MNEKDIILKAIDLLKAIKDNDLTQAKELVDWLNLNFVESENLPCFNEVFPFYELYQNSFNKSNEALFYVLNNLDNVKNIDRIRWIISVQQSIHTADNENMRELIISTLALDELKDYHFPHLIQLCVTIDDYDLLEIVRDKLSIKEE